MQDLFRDLYETLHVIFIKRKIKNIYIKLLDSIKIINY